MQIDKIIRSNRKSIALQINENAELIVRAPFHVPERHIEKFIEEKRGWIIKAQQKATARSQMAKENSEFRDGKLVMYLGREYEIRLNGRIKHIELCGGFMEFPFSKIGRADDYLTQWYKRRAKETISPRTEKYAEVLGLSFSKVGITSARKRWGSCNSKGSINFSYRLVMAPAEIIDYVIVHELMHLKEMNHSTRFWAHVGSIIPDYRERKKWLRDNQNKFII